MSHSAVTQSSSPKPSVMQSGSVYTNWLYQIDFSLLSALTSISFSFRSKNVCNYGLAKCVLNCKPRGVGNSNGIDDDGVAAAAEAAAAAATTTTPAPMTATTMTITLIV